MWGGKKEHGNSRNARLRRESLAAEKAAEKAAAEAGLPAKKPPPAPQDYGPSKTKPPPLAHRPPAAALE